MKVIGITGGIGSGKSTAAHILKKFGAKVIDADLIAREIVGKGQSALQEIVDHFGDDVLNEKGELDRKKLASIVFNSKKKLETLNKITHKYIAQKIYKQIDEYKKSYTDFELIVIDAAIPLQNGFLDVVDEVWVVLAPLDTRIERVKNRSGFSSDEAVGRIKSQMKDEEYLKFANKVIMNDGDIKKLKTIIKQLIKY